MNSIPHRDAKTNAGWDKRYFLWAIPAVSLFLYLLILAPLAPSLIAEWIDNPYYSHGFLIPPLSLFFLWRKRKELAEAASGPSGLGIPVLGAGAILLTLSAAGYQFFIQCFSAIFMLAGLILVHGGKELLKKSAFSVCYLLLMIPMPQLVYNTLSFNLQLLSTRLTLPVVQLLGIKASAEGNIIYLPTAPLIVAAPCSGLRGLIAFTAGSLAIGYILQKRIWARAILVFFAIPLAMAMNTARLVTLAVVMTAFKMDHVPEKVHDITGIVLVIAGLFILSSFNDLMNRFGPYGKD